jgi:tRNA pseudouridine55 synthase
MIESGILVMNKPQGFTSFDVIGKLRGILKMRKLGHTGTLDPMATGVLPVLIGRAARACDILPDERKAYRAGFQLGTVTDTQDSTGTVLETHAFAGITAEQLRDAFSALTGEIQQIPPMYSAVQVNGRRLYELVRQGREIERPARTVFVERITLTAFDAETGTGTAEICCGKGTYVRTILHDMGQVLRCGACMTALTRTAACGFTLDDAYSFAEVQQAADEDRLEPLIIPTDRLFTALPALTLSAGQTRLYRSGVQLDAGRVCGVCGDAELYRIYADDGSFLGLAALDRTAGTVRVYKNL